ncbi:MAG: PIN domain-containing protein [Terriglobales bacterium]
MKVLVDTSVWSLALRRKDANRLSAVEQQLTASLAEAIRDGRVAMLGPIRQELLSGIRDAVQFQRIKIVLEAFEDEPLTTEDYEEAARMDNECRSHGLVCGPVDILICSVAHSRGWRVLSRDASLIKCAEFLDSLPRKLSEKRRERSRVQ